MEKNRMGMCIAAMVLGIAGILMCSIPFFSIICAILGVVFGAIGLRSAKGRGFAKAGLITGICGIALSVIVAVFYIGIISLFEPNPNGRGFYYHYDSRDRDDGSDDDEDEDDDYSGDFYDFYEDYFGDYFGGYDDRFDHDYDERKEDHHYEHHDGMI